MLMLLIVVSKIFLKVFLLIFVKKKQEFCYLTCAYLTESNEEFLELEYYKFLISLLIKLCLFFRRIICNIVLPAAKNGKTLRYS